MKTLIGIPARYASTRFPGKPLAKIAGKEMLVRVWENANKAAAKFEGCEAIIATEDQRIQDFCDAHGMRCMMTSDNCLTGTDRIIEVVSKLPQKPEFIVNLQGDNPICPTWFIEAVFGTDGNAFYFSKNIIPAIRKEDKIRAAQPSSPVYRQVGLYGYRMDIFEKIKNLPEGVYEKLEGLEQLRWIENGIKVKCVKVDYRSFTKMASLSGVDSPEDIARVEAVIKEYGEF